MKRPGLLEWLVRRRQGPPSGNRVAAARRALRVFVSYSRQDSAATDALVHLLEVEGHEVSIDRRTLQYGHEWQQQLAELIQGCDVALWVLSPASVSSRWCQWELAELARLHKRVLPVRLQAVDLQALPAALASVHILPAEGVFDGGDAGQRRLLLDALVTDLPWAQCGTALGERARQWRPDSASPARARAADTSALLRGGQLREAERWQSQVPERMPSPSAHVLAFILASRRAAAVRLRWASAGVLVVAGILAAVVWQRQLAVERQQTASVNESRGLAGLSGRALAEGDAVRAALLALAALPETAGADERPHVPEAERALYAALLAQRELRVVGEPGQQVIGIAPLAPMSRVPALTDGNRLQLYDLESGQPPAARQGTDAVVTRAHWRADGRRGVAIAGAQDVHRAFLWDLAAGQEVAELKGHDASIAAVGFSGDGRLVATLDGNGRVRLFDADRGVPRGVIETGLATFTGALDFSPDGATIAVGGDEGHVQTWDVATRRRLRELDGEQDVAVRGLRFVDQGRQVLSVDTALMLHDARGQAPARRWPGHRDIVLDLALAADGRRVLTGAQDGTARLWDLAQAGRPSQRMGGHGAAVHTVSLAPDGTRALTASAEGLMQTWKLDPEDGASPEGLLRGHAGLAGAVFTADGSSVVSHGGGTVRAWRAAPPAQRWELGRHRGWGAGVVYSRDGLRLASHALDGSVMLWPEGLAGPRLSLAAHPGRAVAAASFSDDGQTLVTVGADGRARRWRTRDGAPMPGGAEGLPKDKVTAVMSPGGHRLLADAGGPGASLWDLDAARRIALLAVDGPDAAPHRDPQAARPAPWAEFSADARRLVTVARRWVVGPQPGMATLHHDRQALLWDATDGRLVASLGAGDQEIERTALSPDGRQLALGLRGGGVRVLALPGGEPVATFSTCVPRAGDTRWRGLVFSADGQRLLTSFLTCAQVWDWARAVERTRLAADVGGRVGRAVFSGDDRRIVSVAGQDARVWDASTGAELALLAGHEQVIADLAIAPDGSAVVTASHDGAVRRWPLFASTGALVSHARRQMPRCLGPDERAELNLPVDIPCWCREAGRWWPPGPASTAGGPQPACKPPSR